MLLLTPRPFVRQLPIRFYAAIETQASTGGDDHGLLMDALRRRDAGTARSLMERHILARGDYLLEILQERGLWDDQEWDTRESVS